MKDFKTWEGMSSVAFEVGSTGLLSDCYGAGVVGSWSGPVARAVPLPTADGMNESALS